MSSNLDISLIIPVYNEEKNIAQLYKEIIAVTKNYSYEIIFVNDGSDDNTKKEIIALKNPHVKLINFNKNLGKAQALNKGFEKALGKVVFTMDGDLQDDPKEIPEMIKKINDGFDLVSGWKFKRHDPITKTLPSKFFNWLAARITGVKIHDFNCGFKAYKNEVVKNVNVHGELHRYIPALASWKGYKVTEVKVNHRARAHGKSKYGFTRLFKGFVDLLTVGFLTHYMQRPLHFFGLIGAIFLLIGTVMGVTFTLQWLFGGAVLVRPALILAVALFIVGIQILCTGLLAEMIANRK